MATPPYRFWNPRYVDVSYEYSARNAVAFTPRKFQFVLNREDYEKTEAAVRKLLWKSGHSERELEDARRWLEEVNKGTGSLHLLDARIAGDETNERGWIEWLKFEVELCLPRGSRPNQGKGIKISPP
ncbi:MAG: hypothetical protein L0099_07210 [Acidobacteria bacterium]|nr:hypothetical protein [Acidobacteriota bacterium]